MLQAESVIHQNSNSVTITAIKASNLTVHDRDQSTLKEFLIALLYDFCEDCGRIMAALPQGAFAACKLREHYSDRNMLVSRMKSGNGTSNNADSKNFTGNKKLLEYSPVKYNGKLMNSIWGLYNRYSPHNIKGNEYDAAKTSSFVQQRQAVASSIANDMAMGLGTRQK